MLMVLDTYKGFAIKCEARLVDGGYVGIATIALFPKGMETCGAQPLTSAFTTAAAAVKAAMCWSHYIVDVINEECTVTDTAQATAFEPNVAIAA